MITGVGVDVLKVERLVSVCKNLDDPFFVKNFTKKEMDLASKHVNPLLYFASRYAGKEAVFKALGISGETVYLCDIEILTDKNGVPFVSLYEDLKKVQEEKNIARIKLSLSNESEYAVAFAIAESI